MPTLTEEDLRQRFNVARDRAKQMLDIIKEKEIPPDADTLVAYALMTASALIQYDQSARENYVKLLAGFVNVNCQSDPPEPLSLRDLAVLDLLLMRAEKH